MTLTALTLTSLTLTPDIEPDLESADIDLPPMTGGDAGRLLVMLHGAGSTPGQLVMAAVAWQLKFRSARAILLAAPHLARARSVDSTSVDRAAATATAATSTSTSTSTPNQTPTPSVEVDAGVEPSHRPQPRYWIDPAEYPVRPESVHDASERVARRIQAWQARAGMDASQTQLVGFSQGASIALELAFEPHDIANVIIGFAPRLYRLPVDGDAIRVAVHLIHGRYDSVVPLAHAEAALRRLGAIAPATSLDVLEDSGHAITQDHLNLATQRAMRTLFAARRERGAGSLH